MLIIRLSVGSSASCSVIEYIAWNNRVLRKVIMRQSNEKGQALLLVVASDGYFLHRRVGWPSMVRKCTVIGKWRKPQPMLPRKPAS